MSNATALPVVAKTLQTTNLWLDDVAEFIGPDRQTAWHALGAVLRTLRDRLPLNLSVHLGAELPILIRGLYYDQWRPSEQPTKWRSADEFLEQVTERLDRVKPVNVTQAARGVFHAIDHYVEPHQVEHVRNALPEPVRILWTAGNA
ncbi:MAG TPA: DUF2267 domain-containing protein [Pseudolabrys sp.]|nr:DUF2267 domain-containing protein [Pseudolabrys sp.]